jgi:uncharacterized damage-inducible protein DinB
MLAELTPIWKQFEETYAALRQALIAVPDDWLAWCPAPGATCVAAIVQHIAGANVRYCNMIEHGERGRSWDVEEHADRDLLLQRLALSEERVRSCLAGLDEAGLRRVIADRWHPLGPEVKGPLDALWFAHQIVRHSAYHLGQVNYILLLLGL